MSPHPLCEPGVRAMNSVIILLWAHEELEQTPLCTGQTLPLGPTPWDCSQRTALFWFCLIRASGGGGVGERVRYTASSLDIFEAKELPESSFYGMSGCGRSWACALQLTVQ